MVDEYLDMAMDIFGNIGGIASDIMGTLAGSSMLLYAGAPAVLVLLILMMLIIRRRKRAESTYQESILTGGPTTVTSDETPSTDQAGESSFLSDFAVSGAGAIQTEDSEVDPLTEADVFMAYGRYEAAEERLQEAIQHDPNRKELKLKLLELFSATKNSGAFENAAEDFYASLGGEAESDPMWQKVVAMGNEVAPSNPLFSAAAATAAVAQTSTDAMAEDPGVSLSDSQVMDIGLETGVFQSEDFSPAAESSDLDFNLDLGESSETAEATAETADELDFNLDMGSTEAEPAASDDAGLDFSLDTGGETAEAADLDFNLDMGAEAEPAADDAGLDFNLDMGSETATTDEAGGLDFSLDTEEPSSPTIETPALTEEDTALDLGLDMDMGGEEEAEPTMAIDASSLDFGSADESPMDLNLDASDAAALDIGSSDEVSTKLDLAKAYIDMGDPDGARSILDEVMDEGNDNQKQEAQQLIQQIA